MTAVAAPSLDDVVDDALARSQAASAAERAAGRRVIADVVAVMVAGAARSGHARLAARLATGGAAEVAGGGTAPAHLAALLNATAAVALELDESLPTGGHPGAHVVPAALAAAQERDASGAELVDAVLTGYEVAARLHAGRRFAFPSHPHGAIGAIGAAVAVARLRKADPLAAARCAATLPLLPTWEACFEGADVRDTWAGIGAAIGLLATDLAAAGLEGAANGLAAVLDRVADVADDPYDGALLVTRSSIRLYAVAGPLQAAVEAARQVSVDLGALPADSVRVETVASVAKFARIPVEGRNLSARFSLPHAVAVALTAPVLDAAAFAFDASVLELAKRVTVASVDDLQAGWPAATGARVIVSAADGRSTQATITVPLGHPDRPLDDDELAHRHRTLAGARLAERLAVLDAAPSVRDLLAVAG